MSGFEFAFSLFGLVLGLAMAEVLAGFVRVLKARTESGGKKRKIRIGWLTPVIGGVVVVDLVTAWNLAWLTMQEVSISIPLLVVGMIETGFYFIAASLVWPDEAKVWANCSRSP